MLSVGVNISVLFVEKALLKLGEAQERERRHVNRWNLTSQNTDACRSTSQRKGAFIEVALHYNIIAPHIACVSHSICAPAWQAVRPVRGSSTCNFPHAASTLPSTVLSRRLTMLTICRLCDTCLYLHMFLTR